MLRIFHDLHAIVGTKMKFLHKHADDFRNLRFRFGDAVQRQITCGANGCGHGDWADLNGVLGWCDAVENVDFSTVSQRSIVGFRDDVYGVGERASQPDPCGGARTCHGTAWQ